MTPAYELRRRPIIGTLYTEYSLYVAGELVHAQISPYSEDEIEQRIGAHLNPSAPPVYSLPELVPGARLKGAKGGRKKAVTAQGFKWAEPEEE